MAELDDPERLAAICPVYRDPAADPILGVLLRRAARMADAPIAFVSVVGAHTEIFRAHYGLPPELAVACGTSRSSSFCRLVVEREALLVVSDARLDPRVSHELVEQFGLRAYAGAPIHRGRFAVGAFCVVDVVPRMFSADVLDGLTIFARTASTYLAEKSEARARTRTRAPKVRSLRDRAESLAESLSVITPTAAASRSLAISDITPEALLLMRGAVGQALTFYAAVVREVAGIETTARGGPHETEVERISRIVDEIGVMARVALAFELGDLEALGAARALSVSRDVFDAADALAAAVGALISAIDRQDLG